jgi:hypothetical protein
MRAAAAVSTVFAPELVVLLTTAILAGYELRRTAWDRQDVVGRGAVVVLGFVVAFAVYQGVPGVVPVRPPGGEDFFASIGLIAGFAVIWVAWHRWNWGASMPAYSAVIVATSVVHLVVVPFWDVSSHVTYAAVSAGFLTAIDRRFAVTLLVPLALVWSRVAIGAHTVAESIGGLAFAAVIVAGAMLAGVTSTGRLPTAE